MHLKYKSLFLLFLLHIVLINGASAQDSLTSEERIRRVMDKTDNDIKQRQVLGLDSTMVMIERLSRYDTLLKGQLYDYYRFGMEHRKKSFNWNLLSSKITFWVVILLVFSGIVFAGIQFYISLKERSAKQNPLEPQKITVENKDAYGEFNTQLEASAKGIKISSPVLGVIILVISLLFFYLYLAYVYPIQETF